MNFIQFLISFYRVFGLVDIVLKYIFLARVAKILLS